MRTVPAFLLRRIVHKGNLHEMAERGMLEDTLVVFATEFGRTPGTEGADGRDHHPYGFSVWMAGGGVKAGLVHGATDDFSYNVADATIKYASKGTVTDNQRKGWFTKIWEKVTPF